MGKGKPMELDKAFTVTPADRYAAAMHAVAVIHEHVVNGKSKKPRYAYTLWRNVEHLRIVLSGKQLTEEFDLEPLQAAVALGEEYVP